MNMMQALFAGLVWSALWFAYVYAIMRLAPWEMLHDYPDDVRAASTLPEPMDAQKKRAKLLSGIGGLVIFGVLIAFGLWHFRSGNAAFLQVFLYIGIVAMTWNVIDLLVMDWLIVCTLRMKWIVIPGTENCESYKDYFYHFKGFLIGCVYTALLSLVIAGLDYAALYFLIWKIRNGAKQDL